MEFQKPKLTLKIKDEKGLKVLRPSIRKMKRILRDVSLEKKIINGQRVLFRVSYGKAETAQGRREIFDNEIVPESLEDLKWAVEAFLDENLYLPKIVG